MKRKIYIIVGIIMIFTALFAYRFHVVNSRYEKIKVQEQKILDTFECRGLTYTVISKEVMDSEEYEDAKIICVRLNIKNNSDKEQICDFADIKMDFNINSEFIRSEYLYEMNQNNVGIRNTVLQGDVFTVTLPYLIFKEEVPGKQWKNMDKAKCELVFNLYPTKIFVNLKES